MCQVAQATIAITQVAPTIRVLEFCGTCSVLIDRNLLVTICLEWKMEKFNRIYLLVFCAVSCAETAGTMDRRLCEGTY